MARRLLNWSWNSAPQGAGVTPEASVSRLVPSCGGPGYSMRLVRKARTPREEPERSEGKCFQPS